MEPLKEIRIINIDGSEIYYSFLSGKNIVIKNSEDEFNDRFSEIFPPNLDLYYLDSIGKLSVKSLKLIDELYSYDIVNVSFKYPLFLNDKNVQIFPKNRNEVYKKINIDDIRKHLYLNGFVLNGKEYVRYKRSSGSAKSGSCLFIKKELFPLMNRWSMTGLNEGTDLFLKNLTSYEAYKALSLSSIIATLNINPLNILFVKDAEIILKNQNVVKVTYQEGGLKAEETTVDVKNNIFDGEGLLDSSVFKKAGKSKKGMMLLRSRFFKCCAFNTNLKKWFKDNNITDISQLNGITFAKSVNDIVLVASESCLKYLKMCEGGFNQTNIRRWCNEINKDEYKFGIVKVDKPTRFFYGEMVETTYQLLNSLQLKQVDINKLINHYIEYIMRIRDIRNTPEFVRFYLEGEDTGYEEDNYIDDSEDNYKNDVSREFLKYSSYTFKNKICLELIKVDQNVKHTNLFKKRVFGSIIDSLLLKLYNGRVLVNGTYATLFGNPYEFLRYIVKDLDLLDPKPLLKEGEICSSFFKDGEDIVGSRAPHTTMGNVLLAKNKILPEIDEYFNLTKEIVVVDAINNNIQQRLSGCDYDSDSMLITNNKVLVSAAKMNYSLFPVPYTAFSSTNKNMKNLSDDKKKNLILNQFEIDREIANNNVGKIVNLSQLLNSHLWDTFSNGKNKKYKQLYYEIAKLAVLSGAEIDSAKRSFPFDTTTEYNKIQRYAKRSGYYDKTPLFFTIVSKDKNRKPKISEIKDSNNKKREFKTSMDYLWDVVNNSSFDDYVKTDTIKLFDLFNHDFSTKNIQSDVYKQNRDVIAILDEINTSIRQLNEKYDNEEYELKKANFRIAINHAYNRLKIKINTPEKAKLLIRKLEEKDDGYSKLFILLYIIHEFHVQLNYSLDSLLSDDAIPLPNLRRTRKGEKPQYILFGKYNYKKMLF